MAREFTAYVILRDPDTLEALSFAPGDEVPEWAIVGDHVASSEGVTGEVQTPAADDATVTPVVDAPAAEASAVVDEDEQVPPYEEWSKTDLRAEVAGRELDVPAKANVADLVAALQADDAENAE